MEDKIRKFIEESFLVEFGDSLNEDSDLFKEGVMDSFGYIQLCRFLESEFGITFSEQEMATNVLVNLSSIRAFVARKVEAASAG